MSDKASPVKPLRLTRAEMLWLMDQLKASALFGMDAKSLATAAETSGGKSNAEKIIDSLQKKGILRRDGKKGAALDDEIRILLDALFFPERALIVNRNLPRAGSQYFHIAQKGNTSVFHSLPNNQEHFLRLLPQPAAVVPMIMSWFPFFRLPAGPAEFKIERKLFERVRALAASGKTDEALKAFDPGNLDAGEKQKLVRAIAERKVDGAIAWLAVQNGKPAEGDSIALITDGRTGWIVSQEELPKTEGTELTVRRAGADFAMTASGIVEKLTGTRLPRRQADLDGKSVHFALSLDELALSLAAINCEGLSKKMYAGLSRDLQGSQYPRRMKQAQQSLVESGLCTQTESGLPILADDLARAIFAIAKSDSMVQIKGAPGGADEEIGVYIVPGRFFTVYRNYGEHLQLLDHGKYKDLSQHMETIFPDFGNEKAASKVSLSASLELLEKALEAAGDRKEAAKILASDGIPESDAELLAGDLSESFMRSMLIRSDAPNLKKAAGEKPAESRPRALLLLKSPKRSWIFEFQKAGEKGKGNVTDREGFRKALADLIA